MNNVKLALTALVLFGGISLVRADSKFAKKTAKGAVKVVKRSVGRSMEEICSDLNAARKDLACLNAKDRELADAKLSAKVQNCNKIPVLPLNISRAEADASEAYRKMKMELFKYVMGDDSALARHEEMQQVAAKNGVLDTLETFKAKKKKALELSKAILHLAKLSPAELKDGLLFTTKKLREKLASSKNEEGIFRDKVHGDEKIRVLEAFDLALETTTKKLS